MKNYDYNTVMVAAKTLLVLVSILQCGGGSWQAEAWKARTEEEEIRGRATYYAHGLMEEVARNRGMNLGPFKGGVALNRAGDLGRVVWLEKDGRVFGPYLVVDCAQQGEHFTRREELGLVVEVPWELAMEWGMRGPTRGVTVYLEWPPCTRGTKKACYLPI